MATSNTAIKITSLPNIGNNIAPTTLIPVVNMSGVPTTQKANLQIAGNLILAGAGTANFVAAGLANLAYNVVNSNQANITRLGTLNINTLKVSGGTNGQYIQTDGTGNLTWVSGGGSGNGVVGGSNGQIQFNNAGNFAGTSSLVWDQANSLLNTTNFGATHATIYGNIDTINVNASANLKPNAIYTNHYFYSNGVPFTGGTGINGITVQDEGTNVVASANTVNFVGAGVTASNVSGVATITIPGGGGGNANTGNVTFNDVNIIGDGNLYLQPDPASPTAYLDVYLTTGPDIHVAGNGENLILGRDSGANIVVGADGNVSVQSDAGTPYNWIFDSTGNLKLPGVLLAKASDNGSIVFTNNGTDNNGSLKVDGGLNMTVSANSNFYIKQAGNDRLAITNANTDLMASTNVVIHSNRVGAENNWVFGSDGNLAAPGSGYFAGQNMFIGNGSNSLNFSASTLVISASDSAYIQAAVTNVSDIGSADWVAYGHRGADAGGWVDMGFTSSGFSDPSYTITGQGDGYVLAQSFYDGQSPGGRGGNLVLATGVNGSVNDIVFATGGFLMENEFGRISSSNNELQFTSGGNLTGANLISANSFIGDGSNLSNIAISVLTSGSNTAGFDIYGDFAIPQNIYVGGSPSGSETNLGLVISANNQGGVLAAPSTGQNVTIQTNSAGGPIYHNWIFNATGDITLPNGNISNANVITANQFVGDGSQLANVATKTNGSWTLATGTNTVSLSVPGPGTYSIWVNGNIPNGIVTYTATAVVTNNNVPVLGSQYGWYYLAGNALVLTSIPNQFVGTAGSISTATASTTTANVFTFGITNNSGSSQVVNWGYTKL